MTDTFDFKSEGYVCASLHRVAISGCKDCDEALGPEVNTVHISLNCLVESHLACEDKECQCQCHPGN